MEEEILFASKLFLQRERDINMQKTHNFEDTRKRVEESLQQNQSHLLNQESLPLWDLYHHCEIHQNVQRLAF